MTLPVSILTRQFREALEEHAGSRGAHRLAARQRLDELTDQILEARILDGVDPLPPRVDISHIEWDLP